jgi:hypothetical protein
LSKGILSWWKNGNKFKEIPIPDGMKGKGIYFSVIMYWEGDEIDLSI